MSEGGTLLLFPYLITKLCRRANIKEHLTDIRVKPNPYNFPLKIQGGGAPGYRKKRKIDVGKSTVERLESCIPFTVRNLKDIGMYIRFIKELVSGLT